MGNLLARLQPYSLLTTALVDRSPSGQLISEDLCFVPSRRWSIQALLVVLGFARHADVLLRSNLVHTQRPALWREFQLCHLRLLDAIYRLRVYDDLDNGSN